ADRPSLSAGRGHQRARARRANRRAEDPARGVVARSELAHEDEPRPVGQTRGPALARAVVLTPVGAVVLVAIHATVVEVDREVAGVRTRVLALEVARRVPLVVERQNGVVDVVPTRRRGLIVANAVGL